MVLGRVAKRSTRAIRAPTHANPGRRNPGFTFSGDTRNGGTAAVVDTIFLGGATQTARVHIWSHLLIGDDTAGADTAFFGDSRISRLAPTSDAQAEFTRSGGAANFEAVDEIPSDDDTTYVESSTVGQRDRYGLGDLSGTPVTIHGVGVKPLARVTDAGGGALKFGARSGATDSTTTIGLGSGYAFQTHLMRTDPATGVAWIKAGVDALQSLIEVA